MNKNQTSKTKILVLIDWYVPGYKAGGQIRSCSNLVLQLKKYFDFSIITRNTDINSATTYPNVTSDEWTTVHKDVPIYYVSEKSLSIKLVYRLINSREFDIIYLNSFFSFYFTLIPIIIVKYFKNRSNIVLATSGMLSDQALSIKSWKKRIFIFLARLTRFYDKIKLVASSIHEKKDIQKRLGASENIQIGPNLAKPENLVLIKRKKNINELKLVYISRIHPIKNLDLVLSKIQNIDKIFKVQFDIYGPIENKLYWNRCLQQIKMIPKNITCTYKGIINNDQIYETYSKYHFSILPSESENFGYSIVESFISCCPVIISDNTPWKSLRDKKAGFDISLKQPDDFTKAIETSCKLNQNEYDNWIQGAYNYAKSIIDDQERIEQNIQVFRSAL